VRTVGGNGQCGCGGLRVVSGGELCWGVGLDVGIGDGDGDGDADGDGDGMGSGITALPRCGRRGALRRSVLSGVYCIVLAFRIKVRLRFEHFRLEHFRLEHFKDWALSHGAKTSSLISP
jgi:hypothetical protein